MGTHLLVSLGSKEKNRNSLACLRKAGSHSAESYCSPTSRAFFSGQPHQKKTGCETIPPNVWKLTSLRVISFCFLKREAFHTWSILFTHQLVLFHTFCLVRTYLLVFIPIVTRFHTTSCIHTYILVLHTYTISYSLRLSFISGRLSHCKHFTLTFCYFIHVMFHTMRQCVNTCSSSYMFLLKFILTLRFILLNVLIIHITVSYTGQCVIPIMAPFIPSAGMFHTIGGIKPYWGTAYSYCRRD